MDLIEKQDRPAALLPEERGRPRNRRPYIGDPGGDRRELLEGARGGTRDGQSEGGLTGTRRAPQDRRGEPVLLHESAERSSRTDKVRLPDDIVDGRRPQSRGERRFGSEAIASRCAEEIGVIHATSPHSPPVGTEPRRR